MKTKLLRNTVLILGLALIPCIANSQTDKQESQPIVFVPTKLLEESKTAGKLKENTFYWCNDKDNIKFGPKPEQEGEKVFLRIKGGGENPSATGGTKMIRVFNIPEDAKSTGIAFEIRVKNFVWEQEGTLCHLSYSFLKDTKEKKENYLAVLKNGSIEFNGEWQSANPTIAIPQGAQQLIIYAVVDTNHTFDIASLQVTFPKPEKAN